MATTRRDPIPMLPVHVMVPWWSARDSEEEQEQRGRPAMSSSSMARHGPSRAGEAWFCTTGLPSDVVFEVQDMSFHLHKVGFSLIPLPAHVQEPQDQPHACRAGRAASSGPAAAAAGGFGNAEAHAAPAAAAETEIEEAEEEDGDEEQLQATLPGLSRSMRWRRASAPVSSEVEQRDLLEAVVASLPADKGSGSVVTAKFLFALLRTAHLPRAWDAARAAIERKAATQLEQATVEDVLIPSYSGAAETLYDVDCVERVVRHFLAEEEVGEDEASSSAAITEEEAAARTTASRPSAVAMTQVGKLVDNYLAEVASDANLKPAKFCELALAMPDHARIYDDGVYRAVDIYLKVDTTCSGSFGKEVAFLHISSALTIWMFSDLEYYGGLERFTRAEQEEDAQPQEQELSRRHEASNILRSGNGPGACIIFDGLKQQWDGGVGVVKNTGVTMKPDVPNREQHKGGQALAHSQPR
uniref:BTB/POZ domain-containing protein n=1 Tax=Aegilops tauschii TaxID=37682 RepID=N1QS82_AEGTA